ncbi:MAG: hypothetical protein A2599_03580 [Candidatus Staskawiczbacteria bacterium RIFOXYD1_FULL_39_28]|uniref:Uncharacterized protein n=1 Tax=Candidatus Staskawiczbacteria bacterium RIFOXYC1_FULL_38_18 TaxID=1802229 RepID=A0A1G2JCF1_9BACT|nr:MAG: hypothetical protein A2401_01465 [Candidatus Staskawiczbacteria bacterium RIFOXYC1_FULL_38_18]OGZ91520.1 MAG: hypothetical protein A2599_03580 [Candidatus Staskawiczbacteria bacterium RIFOXYD1_FULL_39_28]
MADQPNKKSEKLSDLEKKITSGERAQRWMEKEPTKESKEISADEKNISDELKREIELMQVDESLRAQAEQTTLKIQVLADDDKLKKLLDIAKEKGVVFAVKVAKSMNDPFLLDTLHDILAKEGYYKNFIRK